MKKQFAKENKFISKVLSLSRYLATLIFTILIFIQILETLSVFPTLLRCLPILMLLLYFHYLYNIKTENEWFNLPNVCFILVFSFAFETGYCDVSQAGQVSTKYPRLTNLRQVFFLSLLSTGNCLSQYHMGLPNCPIEEIALLDDVGDTDKTGQMEQTVALLLP